MSVWKLVLAFIARKPLTWAFHALTLALGVGVVMAVFLTTRAMDARVERDLAGVDLVVGAPGSPLQLILSSLFHIDTPTGNIPFDLSERLSRNALVDIAAPISLGDNIGGVRIVGTDERLLRLYEARVAEGRMMAASMEVVLGAQAADRLGKTLGATFVGVHGLSAGGETHGEHLYTVVGVLAPTGSALDRVALTPTQSVWDVHADPNHAHTDDADHAHDDHGHDKHADDKAVAPQKPKEVTAVLVRYKNDATGALMVPRFIATVANTQAAVPALEAARLNTLLGTGAGLLSGFGYGLLALSALGFFVALFAAVQARQRDLVLLRTLGARSPLIVAVTALEAVALGLAGGGAGLALGRLAAQSAAEAIARQDGPVLTLAPIGALEGYALIGAVAIALLAAAAPAILAARVQPAAALKRG